MATAVLTIGLSSNRTLQPLPAELAAAFVSDVRALVVRLASPGEVYVNGARGAGSWTDQATGRTVQEESRTWVADVPDVETLAAELPDLCARYEQDAIALTAGRTQLVGTTSG